MRNVSFALLKNERNGKRKTQDEDRERETEKFALRYILIAPVKKIIYVC